MQNEGAFGGGKRRYNQVALISGFVFGGLAFLSVVTLTMCGVVIAKPTLWAQEFQVPAML